MHQNAKRSALSPKGHLAREWDLFQSVEAGSAEPLVSIWQASQPVVVVGRSCRIADDVFEEACHADGVEVLRRQSGGGSVLLAPGCLNYVVVLPLVLRPHLMDVAASFRLILGRIVEAFELPSLSIAGGTDLALDGRKVSGNAQRRGRRALLHHGTLLYAFDQTLAGRYLKEPARQPSYRAGRAHADFIGNLPLSEAATTARLCAGLGLQVEGGPSPRFGAAHGSGGLITSAPQAITRSAVPARRLPLSNHAGAPPRNPRLARCGRLFDRC